jgi:hypothetical protein
MLIEIKKQTTETIEVSTPFYCKSDCGYHQITNEGALINVFAKQISAWEPDNIFIKSNIREVLETAVPCSKDEFNEAFQKAADAIGKYAVKLIKINDPIIHQTA